LLVPAVARQHLFTSTNPCFSVATTSTTSSQTNCDRPSQDSAGLASSSSHHGQSRTRYALCGRQCPDDKSWNGEHSRPRHPLGTWIREGTYVCWIAIVVQMGTCQRMHAKICSPNTALPIVPGQVNAVQDIPMDRNWRCLFDVRPAYFLRSRLVYRYAHPTCHVQAQRT